MRNFKKTIAIFLSILMLMGIASVVVYAAEPNSEDDFVFKKTDAGAVINKYIGERKNVIIPDKLDGEKVVKINDSAFEYSEATSVIMPDTVTEIGVDAFFGNSLKKITLSKKLKKIGNSAFGWGKLTSIKLPDTVTEIGKYAFQSSGIKKITLPKNLKKIGEGAFQEASITSITIPSKVTAIPNYAFMYCYKLKSVKMHSGIKSIGKYAFADSALTSVSIPSKVSKISVYAFRECEKLKTVKIPKSVTKIAYSAFVCCSALKSVSIPAKVKSISEGAFDRCKRLKTFKVAKANKNFTASKGIIFNKKKTKLVAFPAGKGGSYTISDNVSSLAAGAFNSAPLKTITLGKKIKSTLYTSYNPEYKDKRTRKQTDGCNKLKSFKVKSKNKSFSVKKGVLFNKKGTKLVAYPVAKGKSYTVPKGVTVLGEYCFAEAQLTKLKLNNGLKTIGERALSNVPLKSIKVPSSVTKIGEYGLFFPRTIYGKKGSVAQKYAKEHYITFKAG